MHVIIHLSKSIVCTTLTVNLEINYRCGRWVIAMCQHRFIICNKCPTLVGDFDNGRLHICGAGVYGKFLYLPFNFVVNLKLL